MFKVFSLLIVFLAVVAVAVADVALKKAAQEGTLLKALFSPAGLAASGLYLFQVVVFTFMFVKGWKLSVIGNLQTILYALVVLASGVAFFGETLKNHQILGIGLGIVAVVLINLD